MANLTFKLIGARVSANTAVIDSNHDMTKLTFNGDTAGENISGGKYARWVIHASGNRGESLSADVQVDGKSICRKRTYKFDDNGFVDNVIVFDPDGRPVGGGAENE